MQLLLSEATFIEFRSPLEMWRRRLTVRNCTPAAMRLTMNTPASDVVATMAAPMRGRSADGATIATAAGLVIAEEAGARVTDFGGGAFSIYSKEILASNGLIHDEMIGALGGKGDTQTPLLK